MAARKKIHIWRLLWVVFIIIYCILFFYNMFRPQQNWHLVYIYTLMLITWFCLEYYERHLFFQTGLLSYFNWMLRISFALFFYSSVIIGIATIVWWRGNRMGFYPFTQIIGIGLLIYSIIVRRRMYRRTIIKKIYISGFYFSLYFLTMSVALAYGSLFLLPFVVIIGYPLIFLMRRYEITHFDAFVSYIAKTEKIDKITAKNYYDLWAKYLASITKTPAKKTRQ
jgi:hypothetical protein